MSSLIPVPVTLKPIYNVIPPRTSNVSADGRYAPSPPTAQVRPSILIKTPFIALSLCPTPDCGTD